MASAPPHRLLSVDTPLGPGAFLLTGFSGKEELSRLFRYELEMLSERDAVAAGDLVGRPVAWSVRPLGCEPRPFHGVVQRFAAGGREVHNLRSYRAVVVPRLWLLARSIDCRVFANRTLPEIVEAVFAASGFTDYEFALRRPYARRDCRVQYRETAFHFVSRLLEEEGVFYFFRHEEGKHTLVLADNRNAYHPCPEKQAVYSAGVLARNRIASWEHRHEIGLGGWTPTGETIDAASAGAGAEWPDAGDSAGAEAHDVVAGSSGCCTFAPGGKFALHGHACQGENRGYVLVAVEHAARDDSFAPDGGGKAYGNTFTCIPDSDIFRPAPVTPRPVVRGPQTAVAVGPTGQEDADDEGRATVRFVWGRRGEKDGDACRVRVARRGADGGACLPHVGQEVVVDFIDGDPDRPLIAARDFGGGQTPPREEDAVDENDPAVPAEMDSRRVVLNDDELSIGNDQTIEIRNNRSVIVKEGDEAVAIEKGGRTVVVSGDDRHHIKTGDREVVVESGHDIHLVQVGRREVVVGAGDDTHRVGKGDRTVLIESGDDALVIKRGNQTTRLDLGGSTTEAAQVIEFRVGPSIIKLEPTGITIQGMAVTIEGHAQTEVKGLMTRVGADGVLAVKGGATLVG